MRCFQLTFHDVEMTLCVKAYISDKSYALSRWLLVEKLCWDQQEINKLRTIPLSANGMQS